MSAEQLITDHLDLWTSAVTTKRGRGAGKGRELTGIKKLRELILELAVRGKLVKQDPNDEPASVLLERIAEEKARLVKEGKIKKSKGLSETTEDKKPFVLPTGWVWARFDDIAFPQAGFAFKSKNFNGMGEGLPIIRIRDVGQSFSGTYYSGEYRGEFLINKGEYLVGMDGIFRVAKSDLDLALLNQRVTRLKFYSHEVSQDYFANSLQLRLNELQNTKSYTTVDHLSGKQISESLIGIPPKEEQWRIINCFNELMVLCDRLEQQTGDQLDAHEVLVDTLLDALTRVENADEVAAQWARLAEHFDTLFITEASIDKLKQAILQLAVMGQLVEQDPNDEPASVLLEKIAEEKARLVEEGQLKRSKNLPPITDSEKPYALPKSWQWTYFQSTGHTRLGKMLDNAKNSGNEKEYLRNTNVQWWGFNLSDVKKLLLEEHELTEYSVKDGDLLICEGGEPGRCAVWQNVEREIYIQKAIHRHRTLKGVNPHFLKICLTVSALNGQLSKLFTGATIKHLPGDKLAKYICPFPPVPEQHRIVSKVDELMALCDQLKTRLSDAGDTRTHLAETVVTQAME